MNCLPHIFLYFIFFPFIISSYILELLRVLCMVRYFLMIFLAHIFLMMTFLKRWVFKDRILCSQAGFRHLVS